MTNYLIKHTTHTTGEIFTDVTKIRDNETYQVVEAESKEEALEIAKEPKGLLSYVPSGFNNGPISKALKDSIYRKDSE
ncbi:DUF1381 domain-containing protein [Staphylococcus xylosus]|uniref:DUF1381 domain-containing protein n=1 Tax=Staphylococcus xylosus TaxID=1288 RepID=UPI003F557B91